MGKINELIKLGWSHWYVRFSVLSPFVLSGMSVCAPVPSSIPGTIPKSILEARALETNITCLGSIHASQAYERFQSLVYMQELLTGLMIAVCFIVCLCYLGWTLDAGYTWVRHRQPLATEQVIGVMRKLWERWYIRLASVIGLIGLWIFLPNAYLTKCAWDAQELPELAKYILLACGLLLAVVAPVLIVAGFGWMLDIGYHWLRASGRQNKPKES